MIRSLDYYYKCHVFNVDPSKAEAQIFYQKMKADYYRYLSEVRVGNERDG